MTTSRRSLLQTLCVLAASTGVDTPGLLAAAAPDQPAKSVGANYFNVNATYSQTELAYLYQARHAHGGGRVPFFNAEIASLAGTRDSVLFYWDMDQKKLVNPFNLKADPSISKDKSYTINAEVLNFHPSSTDADDVWSNLQTNLQLTFRTQATDANGDALTSITMAGLNFAQEFLGGKDGKLLSVPSTNGGNNLTSFAPSEQVSITNGEVSLMVGLAGQKKGSFWDTLVAIFKQVTDSPVFGLLPIPKLYQTAADTIGTLLSQLNQAQGLVQVLNGKKLQFRIYDGSSFNPFVLRPGYWVILDAQVASGHMDSKTHDINDWMLDLPGQLYELKDNNGEAVDITYSVAEILLPEAKKSS